MEMKLRWQLSDILATNRQNPCNGNITQYTIHTLLVED